MKPRWEMTVPVLSTLHLPGPNWSSWHPECPGFQIASTDCGWFLALGHDAVHAEPAWISALRDWVLRNYDEEFPWVRFDADGDVIDDLATFAYVWEVMEKTV